jgi:hypothetical protein
MYSATGAAHGCDQEHTRWVGSLLAMAELPPVYEICERNLSRQDSRLQVGGDRQFVASRRARDETSGVGARNDHLRC